MARYLKLYSYFLRFSLTKALEFRFDFWFRIGMDVMYYIVQILFFKILFLHTSSLGLWNESQVMIFVAVYMLKDALYMTFFANNSWWLPYYINRGDLDYYLVRPVSTLFFLSLREFAANSFINLLMTVSFLVWTLHTYPIDFTLVKFCLFLLLLFVGVILHFLLNFLLIIPVFWTQSERGFSGLMDALYPLGERPHHIYEGWFGRTMKTILPFALFASLPCEFLFRPGLDWGLFFYCLTIALAFFLMVLAFWNWGLRNYSSASS
jgi:ABC-2 type transport system permease protein